MGRDRHEPFGNDPDVVTGDARSSSRTIQVSRRPTRRRSRQEGAVAVEFAIIMVLFFVLVSGMIDFGFVLHSWHMTATGSREGARKAAVVVNDVTAPSVIEGRVRTAASTLDQSRLNVTITCSTNGGTSFGGCPWGAMLDDYIVRVAVDYQYNLITPLPNFVGIGSTMNISSMSEARYEGE